MLKCVEAWGRVLYVTATEIQAQRMHKPAASNQTTMNCLIYTEMSPVSREKSPVSREKSPVSS